MTALSVNPPFPVFTDVDGDPLDAGYVYIGTSGLNPITNPINVYWDEALTVPAAQPIRTVGGYPSYNGSPGRLYVNSEYSITVRNKNSTLIYSSLTTTDSYLAGAITFIQDGAGAVATTVESELRERISITQFGATGDGVTDDWAAIQAALDYAKIRKRTVWVPAPDVKYLVSRPLVFDDGVIMIGDSRENCVIEKTGTLGPSPALGIEVVTRGGSPYNYDYDQNAVVIIRKPSGRAYPNGVGIHNVTLKAASGVTVDYGVYAPRLARSEFSQIMIDDVTNGWFTHDSFMCLFRRVECWNVSYGFRWENDGSGLGTGTSCTFIDCWTTTCDIYGWYLFGLTYSSLISCASEAIQGPSAGSRPVAWFFNLCKGLSVFGCGSESVKGFVFRISNGSVNIRGGEFFGLTGDTFSGDTATIQVDSGAKVTIDGGTIFRPTTSVGNIYNELVLGANSQLIYSGGVVRPTGGNTNPLFTGGGEITVLALQGEGYTRQDSTGTYYAVESSTSGTVIPTSTFTLTNGVGGFTFPAVLEPVANNRVLQWQNSSATATGGWEFYATNGAYNAIRLGVYNNGTLRISPPTATTVGAAGGASALPATPTGYITVNIAGTDRKIPYYNT